MAREGNCYCDIEYYTAGRMERIRLTSNCGCVKTIGIELAHRRWCDVCEKEMIERPYSIRAN